MVSFKSELSRVCNVAAVSIPTELATAQMLIAADHLMREHYKADCHSQTMTINVCVCTRHTMCGHS